MFLGGKMFQVGDIVKSIFIEFDDIEDCGIIVKIGKTITISWFDGNFSNDYMAGEIELVTLEPS
jgi:hypothetical protein